MTVQIYRFNHLSIEETDESMRLSEERLKAMSVSDVTLEQYVSQYFASLRSTVEEFFPQIAKAIILYAHAPFHTYVVRLGPNGVIIGHRRSVTQQVEVKAFEAFDPPFPSPNIFDISKQLGIEHWWVSFEPRSFDENEAHAHAVGDALAAVLEFFWITIPNAATFEAIVTKLIVAEGVRLKSASQNAGDRGIDALGTVCLPEPAGYRRFEEWAFEFKNLRVSAAELRQCESILANTASLDCVCFVTSDDLTSVGQNVVSDNPKLRVWDRDVLNGLIHRHPNVLRSHFDEFPNAVEVLSRRLENRATTGQKLQSEAFAERLNRCPAGQAAFAEYEAIGIDVFSYLFGEHLGPAKPQSRTLDEKQRRDVLYRNNRSSRFFDRCFHRFGSDSLIVDFKNYGDEITSSIITDVDKYANKALGRLVLVVSRKGAASSVEAAQVRVLRDSNTVVLVLSDADLLEMTLRKEQDLTPEDVIEDKLDELLRKY